MIQIFICPRCGSVRMVSRRKEVSCLSCDQKMERDSITFLQWSEMSNEEREAYIAGRAVSSHDGDETANGHES